MLRLSLPARIIVFAALILYVLIVVTPFGMVFMNSFKSMRDIYQRPFSLPTSFNLTNYERAWESARLGQAYFNSIFVTIMSIAGILIVSSMLAFMISRYRFRFRKFLYLYIIMGLALPARLAIIPIYVILIQLRLIDTHAGLIIVYIATGISFATFLLKRFMDDIPKELEESAVIDGATPRTIFFRIALPLTGPGLVVVGLVNFVAVWNDFFFPFIILTSRARYTMPLAISGFFGEFSNRWDLIAAALSLGVIPIMILFFFFSKYFITGMTQGALK